MEKTRNATGLPLTAGAQGALIPDITSEQRRLLSEAGTMTTAEAELRDLYDTFGADVVKTLFPEFNARTNERNPGPETMCAELQKMVASVLLEFAREPWTRSRGTMLLKALLNKMLQASMIGPVIERLPGYTPVLPLVLMTAAPKDFQETRNGIDPLEYEDPIDRGEAYNFDPEGGGAMAVPIEGNRTTIYPYFKATPRHTLSFWEWAKRQIKPILHVKRKIFQELAKGWDEDLLTHFDDVVPDGSLYSGHASHTESITNAADAVTHSVFKTAAKHLRHTGSGTKHIAVPGYALTDPLAVDDIENWGTDVWTEIEVSEAVKTGWSISDESLRTGKKVYGFEILQTPLELGLANRKVRFFGRKEQVGYFIPVTVNGKRLHVNVAPMSGDDPDFNALRNVTTPPGYTFYIEAWQGGALQIVNPYALSMISHS